MADVVPTSIAFMFRSPMFENISTPSPVYFLIEEQFFHHRNILLFSLIVSFVESVLL